MPWIDQVPIDKATGPLKREFDKALARTGKVWNIVHAMSLNPLVMRTSMEQYKAIMFGPSPLSRFQRELLATVVSVELACHYWTQAHAHDLRAEVDNEVTEEAADRFVHQVVDDWRTSDLGSADRALCEFAVMLTKDPHSMSAAYLNMLRSQGFDDRGIHDAVQVVAYFNYITRIADALGVEPEADIRRWGSG